MYLYELCFNVIVPDVLGDLHMCESYVLLYVCDESTSSVVVRSISAYGRVVCYLWCLGFICKFSLLHCHYVYVMFFHGQFKFFCLVCQSVGVCL